MDATLNHASKLLVQERKRLFRPVLLPGQVLLQWCFLEMECTRNACRLVFRIFEYVIWFCWVFTERVHCMESAQMRSYIWSVLSCTQTKYGDLLRKSPYSVWIQENTDQKQLPIWTLFTHWWNYWLLIFGHNWLSECFWPFAWFLKGS